MPVGVKDIDPSGLGGRAVGLTFFVEMDSDELELELLFSSMSLAALGDGFTLWPLLIGSVDLCSPVLVCSPFLEWCFVQVFSLETPVPIGILWLWVPVGLNDIGPLGLGGRAVAADFVVEADSDEPELLISSIGITALANGLRLALLLVDSVDVCSPVLA